jgi:hypothetical protein
MKKIITLLFCVGVCTISFAQYNHPQNDDGNYRFEKNVYGQSANSYGGYRNFHRDRNDDYYNRVTTFSARERNFQIEQINSDFIFRVKAIQNDCYLRRFEKKAAIRNAEIERSRQIAMVNDRFNCNR